VTLAGLRDAVALHLGLAAVEVVALLLLAPLTSTHVAAR
jgi:hypothetical protein